MTDSENFDPADELRADIESAIEGQQHKETESAQDLSESQESEKEVAPREDGRDEKGRFVAKTETGDSEKSDEEPKEEKVESDDDKVEPTDEDKPVVRPPPGFSVASKAAWETLPQSVRDDIAKREQEVDNGFKRYSGLGKFAEEAERNGTTLQNAVNDYVSIENSLRQNFVGGIEFICQRMGIHPGRLAQVMATKYPGQQAAAQTADSAAATNGSAQATPTFDADAMRMQFTQIARAEAERVASGVKAEAERRDIDTRIAAFSADPKNKFFQNVRQDMAILVHAADIAKKDINIEQAYDAACWQNPEIRALLINEASSGRSKQAEVAASKARNAAKSVGGSPTPGANTDGHAKRQDLSLEDEIRANVDAQMGTV